MKIEYSLDYEEGIEMDCLLGKISLSTENESFSEDCIILDSWFCTFIEGLIILKRGNNAVIDLLEEPYGVRFLIDTEGITLSIPKRTISVKPAKDQGVSPAYSFFAKKNRKKLL